MEIGASSGSLHLSPTHQQHPNSARAEEKTKKQLGEEKKTSRTGDEWSTPMGVVDQHEGCSSVGAFATMPRRRRVVMLTASHAVFVLGGSTLERPQD